MKKETKRFEILFNRHKKRLEKKGVVMFHRMFKEMYASFLKKTKTLPPEKWYSSVKVIKESQVEEVFLKFYPMFASSALLVRKHLLKQKSAEDELLINTFEAEMRKIVTTTAGEKITSIVDTTKKILDNQVREVLTIGETEGLGIPQIQKMLVEKIGVNLKGNVPARARAIAQTEMISASNSAAMEGAKSTGLETRKFWSTSGLPGVRTSHNADQEFSDSIGGLEEEEIFPNTGCAYPGDPRGAAAEVIKCRCTLLIEIV